MTKPVCPERLDELVEASANGSNFLADLTRLAAIADADLRDMDYSVPDGVSLQELAAFALRLADQEEASYAVLTDDEDKEQVDLIADRSIRVRLAARLLAALAVFEITRRPILTNGQWMLNHNRIALAAMQVGVAQTLWQLKQPINPIRGHVMPSILDGFGLRGCIAIEQSVTGKNSRQAASFRASLSERRAQEAFDARTNKGVSASQWATKNHLDYGVSARQLRHYLRMR